MFKLSEKSAAWLNIVPQKIKDPPWFKKSECWGLTQTQSPIYLKLNETNHFGAHGQCCMPCLWPLYVVRFTATAQEEKSLLPKNMSWRINNKAGYGIEKFDESIKWTIAHNSHFLKA